MRIAQDVLSRYVPTPTDPRRLRDLLDDLGLEVKRVEEDERSTVFTLELLANRGDHYCYDGVATELAVRQGETVRWPSLAELQVTLRGTGESPVLLGPSEIEVRIESPLCLAYSATLLERTDEGQLEAEDLRTLHAAGIHSLSPPVDATNLVNLELGQPTHAFDADTLRGPVVIRESRAGEQAWPLFQEGRIPLPEGTLVIADDEKILAIAGVIGCEESKTTEHTQRLLLESATFDPIAVRKASRALNIHTDSSARFERGADPTRAVLGARRVVHLLEEAGYQRVGPTALVSDWVDPKRRIPLDTDAANAFLGTQLSSEAIHRILQGYGFEVRPDPAEGERLQVQVPPRRLWDVEHVQDLYEEIVRAVGYNETPIGLPPVDRGALPTDAQRRRAIADQVLTGLGFYEVITDGFYGRDARDLLGFEPDHPLYAHVETANALDRAYSLLKNNGLAQAVQAVATNLNRKNPNIQAYEWTRLFYPDAGEAEGRPPLQRPCREEAILWAVASGTTGSRGWAGQAQAADSWFLKGLIRELAVALRLDLALGPADPSSPLSSALHPTRQATITAGGHPVGILGEVHPAVLKRAKIKAARPVYLQIRAEALQAGGTRPPYVEPPSWQPIVRSLAFTLPPHLEAGRVVALLKQEGPPWLERVQITDLFLHEQEGQPARTVTFALHYANDPADQRSSDQVNETTEGLIQAVVDGLSEYGVRLR